MEFHNSFKPNISLKIFLQSTGKCYGDALFIMSPHNETLSLCGKRDGLAIKLSGKVTLCYGPLNEYMGDVHKLCRVCRGGEGGSTKDDLLNRLKDRFCTQFFRPRTRPKTFLQCFALNSRCSKAKHCTNVLGRVLGQKTRYKTPP